MTLESETGAAAGGDEQDRLVRRVLAAMAEGLAYGTVLTSPELVIEWVSPASWQLLGYRPHELMGRSALELCHPDEYDRLGRMLEAVHADGTPFGVDPAALQTNTVRLRHADGSWRSFDLAANDLTSHPDVRGFLLVVREATAEHRTHDVLRRMAQGEPLREVLAAVADLARVQVRGADVSITVRGAGRPPMTVVAGDVPARPPELTLTIGRDAGMGDLRLWLPEARPASWWARELAERAADLVGLALERELGEAELRRAARTDPLTGATNRAGLAERLDHLAANRWGGLSTVLYADLDDFKAVNDELGHAAGDAVLVECASRLRACLRRNDLLARPGGDEFVAVCTSLPDAAAARTVAERMVERLREPIAIGERSVRCGVTVGVAMGPGHRAHELLVAADDALLRAKRSGKGRVEVTTPG